MSGLRTFTYDCAKLRLQSENLPAYFDARVLTCDYQAPGAAQVSGRYAGYQLGSVSDPDQDFAVSYGYDTAGRLNGVTSPAGSYAYGYTPNSNLFASVTSPVHVAATVYEPQRDVIDYVENKVGTTTISKYDYTVNAIGQRTARAQTGAAFPPSYGSNPVDNFAYNPKGEVISSNRPVFPVFDQTYTYDQIGNLRYHGRTSSGENYTANSVNQYTQICVPYEIHPTFDADGNQLTTALGQAYVWDAENRMMSVEPVVATAGSPKITYVYDGFSRRVRRTAFTFTNGAWVQCRDLKFIYEGWNVVGVLGWNTATGTFVLQKTYTWGLDLSGSLQGAGGVGGLLGVSEIASGQVSASYHYTYAANGNVAQLLSTSGAVVAHYEYDAFGNSIQASGMYAGQNEYRFSTKPLDGASGLYYYGFRYYNPSMGRWLSRDPIGEKGGLNLYGMVGNDSINSMDYLGLHVNSQGDPRPSYTTASQAGFEAESRQFRGINGDPYGGAYRHCVSACILRRRYLALANCMVSIWDLLFEEPYKHGNSVSDMRGEQVGLNQAASGPGSCEVECLKTYPNLGDDTPQPGDPDPLPPPVIPDPLPIPDYPGFYGP